MDEYRKLLRILAEQLDVQDRLLKVLAKEATAIQKLDREYLEHIGQEKELILKEAEALEGTRGVLLSSICPSPHRPRERITLAKILDLCPLEQIRSKLRDLGSNLRKKVLEVQARNRENAELIRYTLRLVTSTIALIRSGACSVVRTYGDRGVIKERKETSTTMPTRTVA